MQYLFAILSHEIWTWETWKRVNASEAPHLPPVQFTEAMVACGPFAEYVRSHGTKNTLLDGKRRSVP